MEAQKHLFSLDENVHYLNCAYKAPMLKSAEAAGIKALIRERNPYKISSHDFFQDAYKATELFAKLIGAQADEIAIIPSTSYGFSTILNNIHAGNRDHGITIEDEFPSGYFALKRWCRENNAKLNVIPSKADDSKDWNLRLLDAINEKTSVVLISSIHWITGFSFDLKAIGDKCKNLGVRFIIDGTQTIGAKHIDVSQIHFDAIICASYKWLFGPYSMALAYIGEAFYGGKPLEESWMNRTNSQDFTKLTEYESSYTEKAGRFNVGEKSHLLTTPILIEGLKQLDLWGVENIQDYCKELSQELIFYLRNLGASVVDPKFLSNHLIGIDFNNTINEAKLKEGLSRKNIILSMRAQYMRISLNVFNDKNDLAVLMEVIEDSKF